MEAEKAEKMGMETVEEVITSLKKFRRSKCEPADPEEPSFSRFTPRKYIRGKRGGYFIEFFKFILYFLIL